MSPKPESIACASWLNQTSRPGRGDPPELTPSTRCFRNSGPIAVCHGKLFHQHIIDKPPSAELKPGQVDQDSLPPYEVLDDILERLVQRQESMADMVAAGHDLAIVEKVVRAGFPGRIQTATGSRQCSRLLTGPLARGWRMPIASRWCSHIG
jgi:NAD+ synthase (glutamine-hydrolysing)